jgi:hypothetical protein
MAKWHWVARQQICSYKEDSADVSSPVRLGFMTNPAAVPEGSETESWCRDRGRRVPCRTKPYWCARRYRQRLVIAIELGFVQNG